MRLPRALLAMSFVAGCARPMLPPVTGEAPPRSPDGVFLDVPSARPVPQAVATAQCSASIALSLPPSVEDADRVLHAYFHAFTTGSSGAFEALLAPGAKHVEEGATELVLTQSLDRRFRGADYSHLSVELAAFYGEVRLVPFEAVTAHQARVDQMRTGDFLVDVPIRLQLMGTARLFGPRVELVLRRGADQARPWQIAAVREPDGPWL